MPQILQEAFSVPLPAGVPWTLAERSLPPGKIAPHVCSEVKSPVVGCIFVNTESFPGWAAVV